MNKELKILKENYIIIDYDSLSEIQNEAYETLGLEKSRNIRDEIRLMIMNLSIFQVDNSLLPIKEFLIRIDSPTGEFLLNSQRKENIFEIDAYISYENVVASYLTAIKTHNSKMANKIEPLLRERIFGFVSKFQDKCEYSVYEYIKENGDLKNFLEGRQPRKRVKNNFQVDNGEYDEYVVFENGEVSIITIEDIVSLKKTL